MQLPKTSYFIVFLWSLQVVTQVFFVATVVYGPALALNVATGLHTTLLLIIIPVVGIVYTALGGKVPETYNWNRIGKKFTGSWTIVG